MSSWLFLGISRYIYVLYAAGHSFKTETILQIRVLKYLWVAQTSDFHGVRVHHQTLLSLNTRPPTPAVISHRCPSI